MIPTHFQYIRGWTEEQDQEVREAITLYERHTSQRFPEDPFSGKARFSILKKDYLSHLDKNGKQIRERWVTHLCPKLINPSIKENDRDLVLKLNEKYPKQWAFIAREIYEFYEKKAYYSDNSIKNFCNQYKNRKINREIFISEDSEMENKRMKNTKEVSSFSPFNSLDHNVQETEPDFGASLPSDSLACPKVSQVSPPIERQITFSDPNSISVHYTDGELVEFDLFFNSLTSQEMKELSES